MAAKKKATKKRLTKRERLERELLKQLHVPPVSVGIKSETTDGHHYGREAYRVQGKDRYEAANKLRWLADLVGSLECPHEEDKGYVILLLRK